MPQVLGFNLFMKMALSRRSRSGFLLMLYSVHLSQKEYPEKPCHRETVQVACELKVATKNEKLKKVRRQCLHMFAADVYDNIFFYEVSILYSILSFCDS